MRACLSACLCLVSAAGLAFGKEPTVEAARLRWLKGNYAEALEKYQALARDDRLRVEAVLGVSRCLQSTGAYDQALQAVEALLKDRPRDARLLARQAELLYLRGRWAEAEKAADAAVRENVSSFLARWVRAQIYRDRGAIKKADAEFRWFVRTYSDRSDRGDDIKDPEELVLVGLAGSENARWHHLADQFTFILQEVYGDALRYDRNYWPAEYQAGMLLLEKYNHREGLAALDKALVINPRCAEALAGKGVAALQRLEFRDAEHYARRALKINPNLPEALRLQADVHLAVGDLARARTVLERARKINGRDEQTLGRVAVCLWLEGNEKDFTALHAEVVKHNPTPGVFHLVLAERLEDRRRYDEAEKHYKRARALRPMLSRPAAGLGLLFMRLGREKEAGELLDLAYRADPFNVRVSNMRKVLRHLAKYDTIRTAHFELRYDPASDGALARYMADYLEKVYEELAAKFKHRPKGPLLVEVFNSHTLFSGRMVALPDLHTIGACTGRVVAMVSPRGRGISKPFNWARVLRHELVHVFNLDQTGYQVPHWLTEGLAVSYEGFARPQQWNRLLRSRVPAGNLRTLDTIDRDFVRPRDLLDWSMAYCQSQLYVEYLTKAHGEQAVAGMLAAYRDGLNTAAALRRACGVDRETFEKGYRKYLEELVRTLGGQPGERPRSFAELKAAHARSPDDLDTAARLAEEYLRRDRARAREIAERVRRKEKKHPRASYVLARLALLGGNTAEARSLLEQALHRGNPDPKVVRALGRLHDDEGRLKQAAEMFELGRRAEPYEREWLVQLARTYARLEDRPRQIAVLEELVRHEADDIEARKRLARLLITAGRPAEAERYARAALEIDVADREARELLYRALSEQKKDAERERLRKLLER